MRSAPRVAVVLALVAAALSVLMAEDGMQPLFDAALAAARRRAEELAG